MTRFGSPQVRHAGTYPASNPFHHGPASVAAASAAVSAGYDPTRRFRYVINAPERQGTGIEGREGGGG